jgi:membrane protein DedA with SNARE-associated domain
LGGVAFIGILGRTGGDNDDSIRFLSHAGGLWVYLLVFILILIQEVGVPFPILPSEVVLLSAGFLASQGKITVVIMGLFATSATLIGNSVLYYISRRFGRAALDRYGKYVHMRPERVDRIEDWIGKRGTPILVYGPLVPILRAYVPALAGTFGVPYRLYIFVLTGAALAWTYTLLVLGQLLGNHWSQAVTFFRDNVRVGVVICVAFLMIAAAVVRWRRSVARARAQHWPETVLPAPRPRLARGTTMHIAPKPQEVGANDKALR